MRWRALLAALLSTVGPSCASRINELERQVEQLQAKVRSLEAAAVLATPISQRDGSLFANVQVAHLNKGAIRMPNTTRKVLMEVGCSDMFTMDDEALPLDHHRRSFLIAFEPLLDKYAVLLARGTRRWYGDQGGDRSVPLAHHHQRGVVLPLAVSPRGGQVAFHVSPTAGCSSMLRMRSDASGTWAQNCAGSQEERVVPSISLAAAIALAGGRQISLLKLDAQGVDLALLQATDPMLLKSQVSAISMEVVASDCPPLYDGQPHCHEVYGLMRSLGYRLHSLRSSHVRHCYSWVDRDTNQSLCEQDFSFYRDKLEHWSEHGPEDRDGPD